MITMRTRRSARLLVLAVPILTVPMLVTGCSDDDDAPVVGVPNPASVFCVEQGGTVDIVDADDGQIGYCELPDGTRVEEWEYYRAETGSTTEP